MADDRVPISSIPPGQRFAIVPEWLRKTVSPRAVVVWTILWDYADRTSAETFVGLQLVSDEARCSVDTARRSIAELVECGAVVVTERHTDEGRQTSNLYELHPAQPPNRASSDATPEGGTHATPEGGKDATQSITTLVTNTEGQEGDASIEAHRRNRDFLWEAFVAIHGQPATSTERGKFNRAVSQLREAEVAPDEYPLLVMAYAHRYPKLQPAVMTIATRVGELRHYLVAGPIRPPSSVDEARIAARRAVAGDA